ncbi:hypothetical protein Pelo_3597 [Pelomyxa schiedti]|nr:hypothetical protein Pelo_3597 [Pelomyxa schiedti]
MATSTTGAETTTTTTTSTTGGAENTCTAVAVAETRCSYARVLSQAVGEGEAVPELPALVSMYEWFKAITGMYEGAMRKLVDSNPCSCPFLDAGDGNLVVQNVKTRNLFRAGKFEPITLGTLREKLDSKTVSDALPKAPCMFEIRTRDYETASKYVDVAYIQGLKENERAVFQVASNFNGVESPSESRAPDASSFTEDYISDRTQGPAASVSAAAAAIARVHAAFYDPFKPPSSWRQTREKQIEFLENIKQHFPVRNGYVILSEEPTNFPGPAEQGDLLNSTKIGLHTDCQVVFGGCPDWDHFTVVPSKHTVDQVFCAAMNCGQGMSGARNRKHTESEKKRRFLLDAAYQGSYLAAAVREAPSLFLTLIGGGVFGNPIPEICQAIFDAHMQVTRHPACKLNKVVLALFDPCVPPVIIALAKKLKSNGVPVAWKKILENGQMEEVDIERL